MDMTLYELIKDYLDKLSIFYCKELIEEDEELISLIENLENYIKEKYTKGDIKNERKN